MHCSFIVSYDIVVAFLSPYKMIQNCSLVKYCHYTIFLILQVFGLGDFILLQVALDYIGKRGATVGVTKEKRIK